MTSSSNFYDFAYMIIYYLNTQVRVTISLRTITDQLAIKGNYIKIQQNATRLTTFIWVIIWTFSSGTLRTPARIPFEIITDWVYAISGWCFMSRTGKPRYCHNKTYPGDIQCTAQAIGVSTFCSDEYPSYLELSQKEAGLNIDNMQHQNGHFYFRQYPMVKAKIPYIHWG